MLIVALLASGCAPCDGSGQPDLALVGDLTADASGEVIAGDVPSDATSDASVDTPTDAASDVTSDATPDSAMDTVDDAHDDTSADISLDAIGDTDIALPDSDALPPDEVPPAWSEEAVVEVVELGATAVTVSWIGASDNVGVDAYVLLLDGAALDEIAAFETSAQITGLEPETSYELVVQARDAAGNLSDDGPSTSWTTLVPPPPPDPATVAPPLDPGVATGLQAATAFLYEGDDLIQTGVEPGTITQERAAILRGEVVDLEGQPIAYVVITVLGHPEYGQTQSRADGRFDLAINGGGELTLRLDHPDHAQVQRHVESGWQSFREVQRVVLTPWAEVAGVVTPSEMTEAVAVEGPMVSDARGDRHGTLIFPTGITATITTPGGAEVELDTLTVRVTEYTVGDTGPDAMPARLPPYTHYNYCVELSIDEAIVAGAETVTFSAPVPFYVENFVGFPVGHAAPVGYYDRELGQWIPSEDGRVIAIVSSANGLAELDITGDGVADGEAALGDMGIDEDERARLAELYVAPQELWRIQVVHFSPYDINWPLLPPGDLPPGPNPDKGPKPNYPPDPDDEGDEECGSILGVEGQTLSEVFPLTGTPFFLRYDSDRVRGFLPLHEMRIPVTRSNVHESLGAVRLDVTVGGHLFQKSFTPGPDLETVFPWENMVSKQGAVWDGRDVYGRLLQGRAPVHVEILYGYDPVALSEAATPSGASSFGGVGGGSLATETPLGPNSPQNTIRWNWNGALGGWLNRGFALGGWSLSGLHAYDPYSRVLYRGDGGRSSAEAIGPIMTTAAGGGVDPSGTGPALQANLSSSQGMAVAPDGSLIFADASSWSGTVKKVDTEGNLSVLAISGELQPAGGSPAQIPSLGTVRGLALHPDGSVFVANQQTSQVWRIATDGVVTVVAGNGTHGFSGDGGPAAQAQLYQPTGIALGPGGGLYIADTFNGRVRYVDASGVIRTVAGNGQTCGWTIFDPCPVMAGSSATAASFQAVMGVEVAPDGSLYVSSANLVRMVDPQGIIRAVAGTGTYGFSGDGGPGTMAQLATPNDLKLTSGGLLIADTANHRLRLVDLNGDIRTVAGSGSEGQSGDGFPPTQVSLNAPAWLAVAPDEMVYVNDKLMWTIRSIAPPLGQLMMGQTLLPDPDSDELYVFDVQGKHIKTLHALTGAELMVIAYDDGLVTSLTDAHGNATTVERDGEGVVTAIVGPFGHTTGLTVNAEGWLETLTDPAGNEATCVYDAGGLMESFTNRNGYQTIFTYEEGRLVQESQPENLSWEFKRVETEQLLSIEATQADQSTTLHELDQSTPGTTLRRTIYPDNLERLVSGNTGFATMTAATGEEVETASMPDPIWGALDYYPVSTVFTTPSGRTMETTTTREAPLDDPDDPTSFTYISESSEIAGVTSNWLYDPTTSTHTLTSPEGRVTVATMNADGTIESVTPKGGATTTKLYDDLGRLTKVTVGSGPEARVTSFTYSPDGPFATLTTPTGDVIENVEIDAMGQVTKVKLPGDRLVEVIRDPRGNVEYLTPPGGLTHTFAYDGGDRLKSWALPVVPDGGTNELVYAYDLAGRLEAVTRPDASLMDFTYDAGGRLQKVTTPDGDRTITYQPTTGNLHTITHGSTLLTYVFDGSLRESVSWSGPVVGSVDFDYDARFRISEETVAGETVIITYDDDDLVVSKGALTAIRDPASGRLTDTFVGSVSSSFVWNPFSEITDRTTTYDAQQLYAFSLVRDALGRPESATETVQDEVFERVFTYDAKGFLASVSVNGVEEGAYLYDDNGNRTQVTTASGVVAATYDAQDRIVTQGEETFTFEANGTLTQRTSTSGDTTTYETDVYGNLNGVILPDETAVTYESDGQDRRVARYVNGVMTQGFLYLDRLRVAAELEPDGSLRSRFVYLSENSTPDYMVQEGVTYALITDSRRSVRLVVAVDTGAIAQRIDYDVWGQVVTDTNPGFQPFGYGGGLSDPLTGLVRFGARDYDPSVGRFIARDPIGFTSGTTNLYAYVDNVPNWYTDPTGTEKSLCDALQDLCDMERNMGPEEFTDHILAGPVMNEHIVRDGHHHNMDGKGGENFIHTDGKIYDLNYIQAGWATADNGGRLPASAIYLGYSFLVQLPKDSVAGRGIFDVYDYFRTRYGQSPNWVGFRTGVNGRMRFDTFCEFTGAVCPESCGK